MTSLSDELESARSHKPRTFVHNGMTWRYRAIGTGPRGLLLLPGAVGDGEAYFTVLPAVACTHKAIAIAYPAFERLDDLLNGLHALAVHEGVTSVDLLGGSFGGMVAQAFLQRYPAFARRVVLSATGPAMRSRAASQDKWARRLGPVPVGVTRALLRAIVRVTLKNVRDERTLWRDFYFEAIDRISKAEIQSRYRLSAELDRYGPVSAADVQGWTGSMLRLEGSADKIAHRQARDALKEIYPAAQLKTFPGGGHAISAEKARDWATAVTGFLTSNQNTEIG